jgi:UPF0716 protein FxsA
VIFGGAFLITPGFLTDVIGVFLLLPPTRAVARRMLVGVFSRRFVVAARRRRPASSGDVEGTAVEVDPPHLRP